MTRELINDLFWNPNLGFQRKEPAFPFYNIVKVDEHSDLLEVAVAGYTAEDLTVELDNNNLKITGKKKEDEREFYYRSISRKEFVREFVIKKDVDSVDVTLENGLLKILIKTKAPTVSKLTITQK